MNVHDRLHSIMTSVILYCQCVQVLPLSPRQPGVTKVLPLSLLAVLGWAGLGWAGLGWAGSELSLASQCPAQAQPRWRQWQCHGAARSREQLCCQSYLDIT